MEWTYAVTFESQTQPPQTFRGQVQAGGPGAAARRAIDAAKKAKGRTRYCSLCIILELPSPSSGATADELDPNDPQEGDDL